MTQALRHPAVGKYSAMNRRDLVRSVIVGALAFAATPVLAQSAVHPIAKPPEDKPFAEHFIVLQLSDSDQKKERLILSVASNLQKAYGQDKIAIDRFNLCTRIRELVQHGTNDFGIVGVDGAILGTGLELDVEAPRPDLGGFARVSHRGDRPQRQSLQECAGAIVGRGNATHDLGDILIGA